MNTTLEIVTSHRFVESSFSTARKVLHQLEIGSATKVYAEFTRELDEFEFYVVEVGHCLAHLIDLCQQLVYATVFLSSYPTSKKIGTAGINRADHLKYEIENYLIRTQSVEDRILKLVNAVFHLGIDAKNCRYDAVSKNLHVKVTDIPNKLRAINKLLSTYKHERNTIIHHESFLEEDMRKIQLLHLLQMSDGSTTKYNEEVYTNIRRGLTREYVARKSAEFDRFNQEIFQELCHLFEDLVTKFSKMVIALGSKCGHN